MAVYLKEASVGHSHIGLMDTTAYRHYSGSCCFPPLIPLASQGKTRLSLKKKKRRKLDRKFQGPILDSDSCRFRSYRLFHPLQACRVPERCTALSAGHYPGPGTLLELAAKPAYRQEE